MNPIPTTEVVRRIGVHPITLEKWLANNPDLAPKSLSIGARVVRLWKTADISKLKRFKLNQRRGRKPKVRVVDCRKEKFDVYIGRANPRSGFSASIWGNPFKVGRDGPDADAVIAKYEKWLRAPRQAWLRKRLPELRGKVLGCYCRPQWPCHGDVLARLADKGIQRKAPIQENRRA